MVKKSDDILAEGISEVVSEGGSIFDDSPDLSAVKKAALMEEAPELFEESGTLQPGPAGIYLGVNTRNLSAPTPVNEPEVVAEKIVEEEVTVEEVKAVKPVPPVSRASSYSYIPPVNVLAVVSLILGILFAPAGIVTGHIALAQIRKTGDRGRGVALAGTIIGYILVGFSLFLLALLIFASSLFFTILGSFIAAFG